MRIVVAPDSFKESLSSPEAAAAITRGLRRAIPTAHVLQVPIADGGEGTVEAVLAARGGEQIHTEVRGPLGDSVRASYAMLEDGTTAVIEMAEASGLALIPAELRDPLQTTTHGTGELLLDAARRGAQRILLGIGGSATVDGGAGALAGLGAKLHSQSGQLIEGTGGHLASIGSIALDPIPDAIRTARIEILCDVDNPLLGPSGAAAVFGPQKGAGPSQVQLLEEGLSHWSELLSAASGRDLSNLPGSGAAGGLGYGLATALEASLVPGGPTLFQLAGLPESIAKSDLVITGEGRIDSTSVHGKVVGGVARLARKANVPVIAFAGSLGDGHLKVLEEGILATFPIVRGPCTLAEALRDADLLLEELALRVGRILARSDRTG